MALADGSDLVARYDTRRVGQLATDDGVQPDPVDVPTLPAVLAAIADATDELKAAVRTANRYSLNDLIDPDAEPDDDPNGRSIVRRLICDLAFGLLTDRRGYASGDEGNLTPRVDQARLLLEQLRRGERILDTDEHAAAGLPEVVTPYPANSGLPGQAYRFFGVNPGRC